MVKPETISSAANPLVKDVRRALERGGLTAEGWCVAETAHLLEEALRSPCRVKVVLAAESAVSQLPRLAGIRTVVLPDVLARKVSGTETGQGVIALVEPPVWKVEDLFRGLALVVVLDGLQDPGNVGTIVRTVEAFGATGVMFLRGTASAHNPKTLRASAGSLFRVPVVEGMEPGAAAAACEEHGVTLYAALASAKATPAETDLRAAFGLIIGNEARGVGPELRARARAISIPTAGVESLNAAMAAGILLYEARRQRGLRA